MDDRGFECRQGLGIFIFTTLFRPALGTTQTSIQWVPGALSLGLKRPGRETDHSPPCSAEVKNAWRYTTTPQYAFMAWCSVKAQGQLYLFPLQSVQKRRMKRHSIFLSSVFSDALHSMSDRWVQTSIKAIYNNQQVSVLYFYIILSGVWIWRVYSHSSHTWTRNYSSLNMRCGTVACNLGIIKLCIQIWTNYADQYSNPCTLQ
jgi:hypothetical protein